MIVPFELAHLEAIDLSQEHRKIADASKAALQALALTGHATTCLGEDQNPVAIFGAVPIVKRAECEVFIFPSLNLREHAVTFWRDITQELSRMRKDFGLVSSISRDTPKLRRFFRRLGFAGPFSPPQRAAGQTPSMLGWLIALAVTIFVDHLAAALSAQVGVVLADPVTATLAITAIAATTTIGAMNYSQAQDAAAAQKSLENQQASELANEAKTRREQAATQAKTGSTFGFEENKPLATGFGFGTAPTSSPNTGRGQLTGMS